MVDDDALFSVNYEFNTGRFRLTRAIRSVARSGIDDSKTIEFRNERVIDLLFELDPLIYDSPGDSLGLNSLYDAIRYTGSDTAVTHSTTEEVAESTGIGSFSSLTEE